MKSITVPLQRNATTPFAKFFEGFALTMRKMVATEEDRREQYLAQSIDHADLAVRERAYDEYVARNRALLHVLHHHTW